jgi:hypothetical protein
MKLVMKFFPASCHFISLRSKYSPQHPVLKHPQSMLPFNDFQMSDLCQIFVKICMLSLCQDCALHSGDETYFVLSVIISRLAFLLASGKDSVYLFTISMYLAIHLHNFLEEMLKKIFLMKL